MKRLSLVIPCFNEAKSLPTLISRTIACALRRNLNPGQFQFILVNNGSNDETAKLMNEFASGPNGAFLRIITIEKNRGYGHGIYSGLMAAGPGTLAWTHADEQCDPEDAFVAWETLQGVVKQTIVKGFRCERALWDRFFSLGFSVTTALFLGHFLTEINAQPKAFDASLLTALTNPPEGFAFDLYVQLKAKEAAWRTETMPVRFPPRRHGKSRWSSTFRSKWKTILGLLTFLFEYRTGKIKVLR